MKGKKNFEGYWIDENWLPHHFYLVQFGLTSGEEKLKWWQKFV